MIAREYPSIGSAEIAATFNLKGPLWTIDRRIEQVEEGWLMSRNDHLSDKSAAAAIAEEEMEVKPSIRDQIVCGRQTILRPPRSEQPRRCVEAS